MEPAMAPDGSYLVFVSNRPHTAGGPPLDGAFDGKAMPGKGAHLWRVERTPAGWGAPVPLPDTVNRSGSIYAPSISADGSLYFMEPGGARGKFQIYRAQRSGTGWLAPQPLPFNDERTSNVDPAVAADESFVVYGSGRKPARGMDLFIVARQGAGWRCPLHLGDTLNSAGSDAEPRLSPDGRTLYFSSERLLPVSMPMQPGDAAQALQRLAWDNGLYNIWQADLAPWIEAAARQPSCS
jgi:Tol biopolymer transport system component